MNFLNFPSVVSRFLDKKTNIDNIPNYQKKKNELKKVSHCHKLIVFLYFSILISFQQTQ